MRRPPPCRAPPISVANPAYFLYVLQDAFVISIVTFSVTVSLAQVFARQHGYTIHANQVCGGGESGGVRVWSGGGVCVCVCVGGGGCT